MLFVFLYLFVEVFELLGILTFLLSICYIFSEFNSYILTLFLECHRKYLFLFHQIFNILHVFSDNP